MTDPLSCYAERIQKQLATLIPKNTRLQHAMHYSLNTGGKHLRGSLLHWVGAHGGASCEACDAPALAIELVHAYSLVHDDLPCMDDDDLRRGQPSCHKQFDEATALLVGDALQSKAFELLSQSNPHLQATQQVALVHALAQAIGDLGMAEGQSQDLQQHPEGIAHTHALKTAALFQAALKMGCIVAQLSPTQTENLSQAGFHFGMAFQWDDDLQDWKQDHPHTPHCDADRLHTQGMRNAARKQAFASLEEAGLNANALDALYRQDTAKK